MGMEAGIGVVGNRKGIMKMANASSKLCPFVKTQVIK
jgi:hypothetical protein